ncbi:MAG TPA: zinc-dependent alcohol dehydrogenase [Gemmatimonadales bacterium]|nr:zinc-dependent alcohol dehydrogenase [Gemmatimonadales bacterium]
MKAVCWEGTGKVDVETVPDPILIDPGDVIIRVTRAAICGSDLHLYDGYNPAMKKGDILGHEFMGEVVEVGTAIRKLKRGDRIVVPFNIACGACFYCNRQEWSLCENSNPTWEAVSKAYGYPGAGLFGYSHMYGGFAGGQAQYVRVPFADVGALVVPDSLTDEQALFLSDIFPTGYMAAENCRIRKGDTIAIWGAGPVGQMALISAQLLGAGRVIIIDRVPERLELARTRGNVVALDYEKVDDLVELLKEATGGRGPDAVIDAVGMEAHGSIYDRAKHALRMETDRPNALREAIQACRPGGTVSIPGVYAGVIDKFPMGPAFGKGLTFRMGQTHTHRYMKPLLDLIERGEVDPSYIISHRVTLDQVPDAYRTFRDKEDGCTKVVIQP